MVQEFVFKTIKLVAPLNSVSIIRQKDQDEVLSILWDLKHPQKNHQSSASPLKEVDFSSSLSEVKIGGGDYLDWAGDQIYEYMAGKRENFDLKFTMYGTNFQQDAWKVLLEIPYGETISYKQQAEKLGDKNKSRAVGMANKHNSLPLVIPCHRVIGANGSMTGYSGKTGVNIKQYLLDLEKKHMHG